MRGMLAGLIASLLAFGFAKVYGEPQVDRAIAFEEHLSHAAAGAAEEHEHAHEIVSREVQATIGLGADVRAKGSIDVVALSSKDISTVAFSLAAGFVGVAAAVSVWTIGTQVNGSYHAADGGYQDDDPTWSSSKTYHEGDVVTYNSKRYSAKVDNPTVGANPASNPTHWLGESSAQISWSLSMAPGSGATSPGSTGNGLWLDRPQT